MISMLFNEGFYEGGSLSSDVPALYPVAIDGRPYLVDLLAGSFKRQSIPLLRGQADTANLPGEQSINPEDLWRRSQESWHHGAGQVQLDRPDSDPARFHQSVGINVWDKWRMSLLNQASLPYVTSEDLVFLATAQDRLYVTDGDVLSWTTDLGFGDLTAVTGGTGDITSITSDGQNVYTAHGTAIYMTDASDTMTNVTASYATGTVSLVRFVKDRLMAAGGRNLYNIVAGGAFPSPLHSGTCPEWTWVDVAAGNNHIYAAGYAGDKSLVYRTAIKPDGTALDIPVVAAELPDGEIVQSLCGYLGFILIGTMEGVRFATTDAQGDLTLGSLIRTPTMVLAFEPQDRFVWTGGYDGPSESAGLGRIDLTVFTAPLTPAYASDIYSESSGGYAQSIVTFNGATVFSVNNSGVWTEDIGSTVEDGYLDTGRITYGIPDPKIAMFLQARHLPLDGSVRLSMSTDDSDFTLLGTNASQDTVQTLVQAGQKRGEAFEIRTTLLAGDELGPVVTRHTLRSYPGPSRGEIFYVPVILHEVIDLDGIDRSVNPKEELERIRVWTREQRLVVYQEGDSSYAVFVEDYEFHPHHATKDNRFWNGTCLIKMKSVVD